MRTADAAKNTPDTITSPSEFQVSLKCEISTVPMTSRINAGRNARGRSWWRKMNARWAVTTADTAPRKSTERMNVADASTESARTVSDGTEMTPNGTRTRTKPDMMLI